MNKKIVAIVLCFVFLATIPLAAGKQTATEQQINDPQEPQGFLGRTYVRGLILGYKTQGLWTTFYAVFCHFKTVYLLREPVSGYYMFEQVQFLGKIRGHIGMFYINGIFHGTPF